MLTCADIDTIQPLPGKNSNTHAGVNGWVVDPGKFELFAGTAGFTSWEAPGGDTAELIVL